MSYQYIETQLTQGIAVIWMNRPEQRNALNDVMINEITDAVSLAIEDDDARAMVQGAAFAGGMGLVAACDIAIASHDARFCLSEVKLGLIPAMISPYVLKAMGERHARRFFLSAEVFDAAEAYRIGFVNDLASPEELDGTINTMLGHLLLGSPNALAQTKLLIRDMVGRPISEELTADTAARIAAARASVDGQEGIAAFFEKRTPSWVRKPPQT